ncbi:hypothetical protein SCLARK_001388 [Spiroplasma clarkii]|uniref:lipoprotein n=1 Tax=Spiroplasma clarkii TaxID=2139 RepID=UPI000B556B01|nr:lipoprotein [Spiroplasma clarkii]ARU91915.1 hypothetical protein SCLARK_001388 [Spiroplasma clarkii]
MKKLLAFFGATSLIANLSANILACAPKNEVNDVNTSILSQLIAEFIAEISKIISDHFSKRASDFSFQTEEVGFFSVESLESHKNVDNNEKPIEPLETLTQDDIDKIVAKIAGPLQKMI